MSNIYRNQDQESQEQWPEENMPQSAVVCMDGWAGRIETPVTVTRRTPKRYECEYADGRRKLVPKYAVRFTPNNAVRVGGTPYPERAGSAGDDSSPEFEPCDVCGGTEANFDGFCPQCELPMDVKPNRQ